MSCLPHLPKLGIAAIQFAHPLYFNWEDMTMAHTSMGMFTALTRIMQSEMCRSGMTPRE